jgi:ATP-dependent protease ClpP protease subunit
MNKVQKMQKMQKVQDDDEDNSQSYLKKHVAVVVNQTVSSHYRVFLDDYITDPSEYREVIQALISAGEDDYIEFLVSSPGGNLQTTIDICNAIRASAAYTRAVITSQANSGASFISIACNECIALPHSGMLVHQPRGWNSGTHAEMVTYNDFNKKQTENFYRDIYKDFMTEREIELCLEGKDFWFDSTEINDRLQKRSEIYQKEQNKALREMKKQQKQLQEPVQKESSKKVKKSQKPLDNAPEVVV